MSFDERAIAALSDGSVIELARRAGILVEEEEQFPDLVRVRLRRNIYET